MQCIILAAGRGTRMKELTKNTPKPMVRVFDKPLLEHKIEMLPKDIDEVILVIGYLGEQVIEHFGDEWNGRKIAYIFQESLNGTGGAIHSAKELVSGNFLVTMGDDLYGTEDLRKLISGGPAVLAKKMDEPFSAGLLRIDENGNLWEIIEKAEIPEEGFMNTGAYLLTPEFFEYELVPISETEFGLPQTLVKMAENNPVRVELAEMWVQVGKPEDIPKAEEFLMNKTIRK
jgi:NDP-sugar pyrophosphorylase family protein